MSITFSINAAINRPAPALNWTRLDSEDCTSDKNCRDNDTREGDCRFNLSSRRTSNQTPIIMGELRQSNPTGGDRCLHLLGRYETCTHPGGLSTKDPLFILLMKQVISQIREGDS